ncbi:hypothetical protein GCM10022223_32300 [Kineosporia mesophila]|uniref:Uncharacterized protein n=1 Tax=Kineosporia mesophila TaxID=566012 RepID=A0ABP6ZLL4_9ACTN|nr:hypothetical protein [Kineosporia mesophila]MCD5354444.1 hypothetical protein [Kineosporia mesophila]
MVWFSIDDGFPEHPKTVAIQRSHRLNAVGLWTVSGIWVSQQLTDGRLRTSLVTEKGGRTLHIRALVAAGLWHDSDSVCRHGASHCPGIPDKGGLTFHDWFDWQRSRRQILRERERKVAAGRAGGKASGASRRERSPSKPEAPASPTVEPPVPYLNPQLLTLVCRRLFGGAPLDETTVNELMAAWEMTVGAGDLETELRSFLMHNVDTDLRNPAAALKGWLAEAAERARKPGLKPVLGCANCRSGWLPDDVETGMPVPCPVCKPHRYVARADAQ